MNDCIMCKNLTTAISCLQGTLNKKNQEIDFLNDLLLKQASKIAKLEQMLRVENGIVNMITEVNDALNNAEAVNRAYEAYELFTKMNIPGVKWEGGPDV
jgi:hypothetical protein